MAFAIGQAVSKKMMTPVKSGEMPEKKTMRSKLRKKSRSSGPLNVQNFQVQQIAQNVGVKVENLQIWIDAREKEMREALIQEFEEKLHEAENSASFINVLISMYAIKMTWGFTRSQEKFLRNLNCAHEYILRTGIRKAFDNLMRDCGTELEFDDFDYEKELERLAKTQKERAKTIQMDRAGASGRVAGDHEGGQDRGRERDHTQDLQGDL